MPVEERELHNNGLSEDTLSVLRDGRNNGNECQSRLNFVHFSRRKNVQVLLMFLCE